MQTKSYSGIHIPLITPFKNNGIDWEGLKRLIDYYATFKIASLIPCGSTGESATLSHDEHKDVIRFCVEESKGRLPIMAGTGSNSTAEAIELSQFAASVGAKSALVVSPYYNRPTQEGIYQYFKAIAEQSDLDIILYNIPARTGSNMHNDTIIRLAEISNIKGIKEGSGDIGKMAELTHTFMNSDFAILTGEDSLLLPCCALGGDGGVMASALVCTQEVLDIYHHIKSNNVEKANNVYLKIREIISGLFYETNPIVIKYALNRILETSIELRAPLTEATSAAKSKIDKLLQGRSVSL